jgi:phosphatidylglycerol:prolipoprotein diacylglycerol transferase
MFWKTQARYEPGKLVGAFIFFYGIFRFGIEFIREPDSS